MNQPFKASEAYAEIASFAYDVNMKASALQAQGRCLAKAGKKPRAIEVLSTLLATKEYRQARDANGRLIGPNAGLLALQLMTDRNSAQFRAVADKLAQWLTDYSGTQMPASQRRFLMRALESYWPSERRFATLKAETLAAEYLEIVQPAAQAEHLTKSALPGVWHLAAGDGRVVAIFTTAKLTKDMKSAVQSSEPHAGAELALVPPGWASPKEPPFLAVPAGEYLPDWEMEVHIIGQNPFAAAASRQRTVYLWTAVLGIVIITSLTLVVAGYLGRQMKLTRLRNDLIATVSHELKTPLASMRVLVDTLLEGRCEDQQQARDYFGLIAKENERLSRLIDNFLTFSRMERNKKAFDFVELDLNEVISAAVDSVADRFDKADCHLDVDIASNLPPISGDRDALITVLLNLLDNAYKYSQNGTRIGVRAYLAEGNVCLAVTDNGIGLSRRAIKKIFNRFYQVDQSLARKAGGCGLGLSIVKFITDAHGASIEVTSQPGKGSTFTVRLPSALPNAPVGRQ